MWLSRGYLTWHFKTGDLCFNRKPVISIEYKVWCKVYFALTPSISDAE